MEVSSTGPLLSPLARTVVATPSIVTLVALAVLMTLSSGAPALLLGGGLAMVASLLVLVYVAIDRMRKPPAPPQEHAPSPVVPEEESTPAPVREEDPASVPVVVVIPPPAVSADPAAPRVVVPNPLFEVPPEVLERAIPSPQPNPEPVPQVSAAQRLVEDSPKVAAQQEHEPVPQVSAGKQPAPASINQTKALLSLLDVAKAELLQEAIYRLLKSIVTNYYKVEKKYKQKEVDALAQGLDRKKEELLALVQKQLEAPALREQLAKGQEITPEFLAEKAVEAIKKLKKKCPFDTIVEFIAGIIISLPPLTLKLLHSSDKDQVDTIFRLFYVYFCTPNNKAAQKEYERIGGIWRYPLAGLKRVEGFLMERFKEFLNFLLGAFLGKAMSPEEQVAFDTKLAEEAAAAPKDKTERQRVSSEGHEPSRAVTAVTELFKLANGERRWTEAMQEYEAKSAAAMKVIYAEAKDMTLPPESEAEIQAKRRMRTGIDANMETVDALLHLIGEGYTWGKTSRYKTAFGQAMKHVFETKLKGILESSIEPASGERQSPDGALPPDPRVTAFVALLDSVCQEFEQRLA